ncbi:hypothetical protein ADZZY_74 [Mycobacterium phage Adzzy]|uniref:hypothetical protein n=1 Tax=Mycobacterium phage Adzzy TaxID=1383059 RepID=UPI0003880965|nr:hypothetical protein ADZZY_74 [Mycobacterium phage Adzzy]AGT14322.1 hypothetical protein ADZZY_74 [Mycobacterium phage Adzzy]ATW60202.1 hypothetical protein SEA_PH8S_74 [Mycobacterium phage Ph8s]
MTDLTSTWKGSPENPGPWDPNHPMLKSPYAPHETAAVLRIKRTGIPGPELMKLLKLKGTRLMSQIQRAMDQETEAHRRNLPIHDALIAATK